MIFQKNACNQTSFDSIMRTDEYELYTLQVSQPNPFYNCIKKFKQFHETNSKDNNNEDSNLKFDESSLKFIITNLGTRTLNDATECEYLINKYTQRMKTIKL